MKPYFSMMLLLCSQVASAHELSCATSKGGTNQEMELSAKAACKSYYSSHEKDDALNFKELFLKISSGEKHLIKLFTENCYKMINPALRSKEISDEIYQYSSHLLQAVCKYPKMRGTIYRGVNYTNEELAEYRVGSKIKFESFSSASKSRDRALVFSGTAILTIKSRTARKIYFSSDVPEERETLILPNTSFIVTANQEITVDHKALREIVLEEVAI